jgi:hypothetical protein
MNIQETGKFKTPQRIEVYRGMKLDSSVLCDEYIQYQDLLLEFYVDGQRIAWYLPGTYTSFWLTGKAL